MTEWSRPCACGIPVAANPDDPFPGVAAHVAREPHRSWSDRTSWFPRPMGLDSTADLARVDVSALASVRPVLRRRPGVRTRRYIGGRHVA